MNYSRKTEKNGKKLSSEQFEVCRKKGTERAFTGKYYLCNDKGIYHCVCCDSKLFSSETKYNSGTGWPSFWDVFEEAVSLEIDSRFGISRKEVLCKLCDAHLGHVFEDGPKPTGLRYCINSIALKLKKT